MTLTHTTLPVEAKGYLVFNKKEKEIMAQCGSFADAAFVARAVNCHDELVRQLKSCYKDLFEARFGGESLFEVRDILSKAEGV